MSSRYLSLVFVLLVLLSVISLSSLPVVSAHRGHCRGKSNDENITEYPKKNINDEKVKCTDKTLSAEGQEQCRSQLLDHDHHSNHEPGHRHHRHHHHRGHHHHRRHGHHHHRHHRRRRMGLLNIAQYASKSLKHNLQPLHDLTTERAAITASLISSSVSLVSVLLLPFAALLTKFLLPFAAGALLSDLIYHLLPHMYAASSNPSPTALLLSIAVFALLDTILRRFSSHSHAERESGTEEEDKKGTKTETSSEEESRGETSAEIQGEDKGEEQETNDDDETEEITAAATTPATTSNGSDIGQNENKTSADNNRESKQQQQQQQQQPIAVSAYINLAADALHNFCDGLTLAAAFSASTTAGIATTIAVILHELPQEMADFSLLLRAGMSTKMAIIANVACALTALIGTLVGLRLTQLGAGSNGAESIMPVAAGALLYMTFASVIPDVVNDVVGTDDDKEGGKNGTFQFMKRAVFALASAGLGVSVVAAVEAVHEH